MQKWIILITIIVIAIVTIIIVMNINVETEYLPEVEIEDEELRKSEIELYFVDTTNNDLKKEIRLIDSKELLKNPYEEIINLLIAGSEDNTLQNVIPQEAKIISLKEENGKLTINFSNEFSKCCEDERIKHLIISSINKTLTQFKEINEVEVIVEKSN